MTQSTDDLVFWGLSPARESNDEALECHYAPPYIKSHPISHRRPMNSKRLIFGTLEAVLFLSLQSVQAQIGSDFHTVTVQVSTITGVAVSSGTVNMNIAGASTVAGQDEMSLVNQTTSLSWGINSSLKKITVNTSLAAPKYTLKLLAVSPTVGTASSEVILSTTAADLMIDVGKSSGSCTLKYTAIALASQGTGTDAHTITFTVITQ